MSLEHDFAIIPKGYNNFYTIQNMKKVSIPDDIIIYMSYSLKWIHTYWNGKENKASLNYYGYSIISEEDLNKLSHIINTWKTLFSFAPKSFYLSTGYLIDEKKYDNVLINKDTIINTLDEWYYLCKEALDQNCNIIHRGV